MLLQLFQNLISNSIKYRGAERPQIHVSAEREPGGWMLTVRDNGVGIEPEDTDRVFGMFKRLHGAEIPGTGIGLALCRKLVERQGGRIWVKSEPGRGSEFTFTIPDVRKGLHHSL
jgi:signal transduction histidine kinase